MARGDKSSLESQVLESLELEFGSAYVTSLFLERLGQLREYWLHCLLRPPFTPHHKPVSDTLQKEGKRQGKVVKVCHALVRPVLFPRK